MDENVEKFLLNNETQLKKIYEEGVNKYTDGLLYIKYCKDDEKVDVIFLNVEKINTIITKSGWEEIKKRGQDKKICMIHNNGKMCIVHLD
jgi:hypothetical protein